MPGQVRLELLGRHLPHLHRRVARATHDQPRVARPPQLVDGPHVPAECAYELSVGREPEAHGAVEGGGGEEASVRREGESVDRPLVALQPRDRLFGRGGPPQKRGKVVGARGEDLVRQLVTVPPVLVHLRNRRARRQSRGAERLVARLGRGGARGEGVLVRERELRGLGRGVGVGLGVGVGSAGALRRALALAARLHARSRRVDRRELSGAERAHPTAAAAEVLSPVVKGAAAQRVVGRDGEAVDPVAVPLERARHDALVGHPHLHRAILRARIYEALPAPAQAGDRGSVPRQLVQAAARAPVPHLDEQIL
mmetsp:Transcript_23915/g.56782  ORF Transcript_23915/g.56782 Transcript_23915/m.56782 type:complete len:311 (-) Transcript_23915:625-1557(-)